MERGLRVRGRVSGPVQLCVGRWLAGLFLEAAKQRAGLKRTFRVAGG
jgi:hypothetical protein